MAARGPTATARRGPGHRRRLRQRAVLPGTVVYEGTTLTHSGYNGDGTGPGNATITVSGTLGSDLIVKALGYAAGEAEVTYAWGVEGLWGTPPRALPADRLRCSHPQASQESPLSQGFNKTARRATRGSTQTGTAAATSTTGSETSEMVDLQASMGNAAVASLVAQDAAASTQDRTRFSSLERATLLASSERMALATMVYSESTPSTEINDEMRALAAVGQNRVDHMRDNPEDQELFGAGAMHDVVQDPFQFEQYGQAPHLVFNDAARFNAEFADQADLEHALAAIQAAAEIENAGNPFSDDYLVFSADEEIPHADRIDESTKVTYGALTFWAFTAQTARKVEEEEQAEAEVDATGGDDPVA